MEIHDGDLLEMKKKHPCGASVFRVLRTGIEFRLQCTGCGREVFVRREKAEKHVKSVLRDEKQE